MKSKFFTLVLGVLITLNVSSQPIINIQTPVSMSTTTAVSTTNPNYYIWQEVTNSLQGCNIYLSPATYPNKPEIYLQQTKGRLAFNVIPSGGIIIKLDLNFDNTGYTTVYQN